MSQSSNTEVWTIGRLLTWTTDFLRKQGADSPRLDAEVLLAHARHCPRISLYTDFGETASETLRTSYRELVRRRAAGTPVAYLVGQREFYSLPFHVTPDVLIPRPETELVVIAVLDRIKEHAQVPDTPTSTTPDATNRASSSPTTRDPVHILDVGTGSGAIAVSLARHAASAQILAVDASPAALEVAQRNAVELGVADRVELRSSDLLAAIRSDELFDVVVSNPPYVSESEWNGLAREVKDHEPRLALVGGPTGTEVIARLIPAAAEHLRPGGWLILEISPMIHAQVEQLVLADGRYLPPTTTKDLAGHPRVVQARRR